MFTLNKTRLIRFKKIVYFLKSIKKLFVKKLYKALTLRHLRIKKTKDKVAKCYYFPLIKRIVKRVIKKCDIC